MKLAGKTAGRLLGSNDPLWRLPVISSLNFARSGRNHVSILEGRFRKSLRKRVRRGFRGYPVVTVAYCGPDDRRAGKVAVGITNGEGQELAELRRWFSETGDVRFDPVINR